MWILGWGSHILWVSMANGVAKNSFVLMDAKDGGGIEAIVNLEEEDMNILEVGTRPRATSFCFIESIRLNFHHVTLDWRVFFALFRL